MQFLRETPAFNCLKCPYCSIYCTIQQLFVIIIRLCSINTIKLSSNDFIVISSSNNSIQRHVSNNLYVIIKIKLIKTLNK